MYTSILLFISFIILSCFHIFSIVKSNKLYRNITKPLLMPMLIIFYLFSTCSPNWLIVCALIFGFLGDIFLMGNGNLFMAGLVSFLIGHAFYIIAFLQAISLSKMSFIFYLLLIPYLIYGMLIFKKLFPHLKSMRIPALLYITVILAMSFVSLLSILSTNDLKFLLPFLGSILFICSDTMLSFNKFKEKVHKREVYVMLTYISAQLLIVLGFI